MPCKRATRATSRRRCTGKEKFLLAGPVLTRSNSKRRPGLRVEPCADPGKRSVTALREPKITRPSEQ